jgi:hypothetical protein
MTNIENQGPKMSELNLALQFVLEVGALSAFAFWGYDQTEGPLK